jgi:hypothetical protein
MIPKIRYALSSFQNIAGKTDKHEIVQNRFIKDSTEYYRIRRCMTGRTADGVTVTAGFHPDTRNGACMRDVCVDKC